MGKNQYNIPGYDYLKKTQRSIIEKIVWPYSFEKDSLYRWRAFILSSILLASLIFGFIALIFATILIVKTNSWGLAIVDFSGFMLCLTLLSVHRIKFEIRASVTLLIFYVIGTVGILSVGPLSGGPAWLFAFAVLSGVLLGNHAAFVAILMNAICLTTIGLLISTGKFGNEFPFFDTPQVMISAGVNFIMLNAITAVSVAALVKGLSNIHLHLEEEKSELIKTKKSLESEVKERKQTEKALKKSEEKYRKFVEGTEDLVIKVDKKGDFLFVNHMSNEIFGLPQEKIIGMHAFDFIHPDDQQRTQQWFNGCIEKKVSRASFENKHINKTTGKIADMLWTCNFNYDSDNELIGVNSIAHNITERKYAEMALKRSEKELRSIFRAAQIGIGLVCDRVFQQVNDQVCTLTGYSKKELIGQNSEILYPTDEEYEFVGKEKYRQIKLKGTGTVETKWKCKDKKIIDIILSSTPIDLNDLSKGVTFTALDITTFKKKKSELIESEEKYRSMMESTDEATYICSSDFRIEYMNPAMIKRTGYDATGETCHKVMYDRDEKCSWCVFEKVIGGDSISYEIVSPKDEKTYNISNSPIFHQDGSISKLTVFRDVTEIKKMEAQLQQSQKMESIGTLAGGIAHDFNNILFPIVGHTEMLLEDVPQESPFRQGLSEIYNGSMRAKNLVKQILTFSRQENSDLKLMKIQPVIKEVLKLIRSTIPTTIEIKQNMQKDCGGIKADSTQIHQIIMNLATNAYHAMEETGGELKVSLEEVKLEEHNLINPEMKPGVYACLIVADTGMGIDKNLKEKIFEPFFTTKLNNKGSGMGLSVVHGIVKSMCGAIQVYSEPGQGTQFHVYLPVFESSFEKQEVDVKKR